MTYFPTPKKTVYNCKPTSFFDSCEQICVHLTPILQFEQQIKQLANSKHTINSLVYCQKPPCRNNLYAVYLKNNDPVMRLTTSCLLLIVQINIIYFYVYLYRLIFNCIVPR